MAANFESLGIMPEIVRALEHELHWDLPRDIQEECIPLILGGGDIMAAAETGSGKTGAFALPIVQVVSEALRGQAQVEGKDVAQIKPGLNPADKESTFVIDPSGTIAQSRLEQKWSGGRGNFGVFQGKYFYEVTCRDAGLSRIGFSTAAAKYEIGTDNKSWGYGGTQKKSHDRSFTTYGVAFGKGDVVGCYIDNDEHTISYSVNGTFHGTAFEIPQAIFSAHIPLFPAATLKNAEIELNFGEKPFSFPPIAPYKAFSQADISHTSLSRVGTLQTGRRPLAIILEPSRELAQQTHEAIVTFCKFLPPPGITCCLLTGGQETKDQMHELNKGVDIVTGTLGKIDSLIKANQLSLGSIKFFCLDEADKLMEKESYDMILNFYKNCPTVTNTVQVLLFSATLHDPAILKLSETICKFPQVVDLKGKVSIPENVDHALCLIDSHKDGSWTTLKKQITTDGVHAGQLKAGKDDLILSEGTKILKAEMLIKIITQLNVDSAIIFVRTRLDGDHLAKFFKTLNDGPMSSFSCAVLHSGKSQDQRDHSLLQFKKGEVRFLIATDVAARGIDIEGLPYVINYTLPEKCQDYVHRIGRTGRADKIGLAISLVSTQKELVWYHTCRSRGEGCRNINLVSAGGCTIWYDEMALLQELEQLLGKPIIRMKDDLTLDLPKRAYGKKETKDPEQEKQAALLLPVEQQLSLLEVETQRSFLLFGPRFSGIAKK